MEQLKQIYRRKREIHVACNILKGKTMRFHRLQVVSASVVFRSFSQPNTVRTLSYAFARIVRKIKSNFNQSADYLDFRFVPNTKTEIKGNYFCD